MMVHPVFTQFNGYLNPTESQAVANGQATCLQNEAMAHERAGDLTTAERLFIRAIQIRNEAFGPGNNYIAINQNSLGELYVKMGKLDEAEELYKAALETRDRMQAYYDAACTRENLAQLYEMKGDATAAKAMRRRGRPNRLVCGNMKCPSLLFTTKGLQRCSQCKSTWYCTPICQKADWKRHKSSCALLTGSHS